MDNLAEHFTAAPNLRGGIPDAMRERAGGKGSGLLRLPSRWYPPTLVIAPGVRNAVTDTITADLDQVDALPDALIQLAEATPTRKLLLRSNTESESIVDRGAYKSLTIEPTLCSLASGMTAIWNDAAAKSASVEMGFLVQPLLEVKLHGHLSNEHRLCRESTRWIHQANERTTNWRVQKDVAAPEDSYLEAASATLAEHALRSVSRALSDRPTRLHLEWVWDGTRVWIVQSDAVAHSTGPAPGDNFEVLRGDPVINGDLRCWRLITDDVRDELSKWPKVRSLQEFVAAGLGHPDLWALRGDQLAANQTVDLRADLTLLCSGHLVIRTDLVGGILAPNLKKSPAMSDPDQAAAFLWSTLKQLIDAGVEPHDVCFIAHRFTRARASALAAAWPKKSMVRVDSIWGLADGLQFLPHDTAWINLDTSRVDRTPVPKTDFLDIEDEKDWQYRTTPSEWIWKSSATSDQLRTIAASTHRLASQLNEMVVVMWFVGILDGYESDCLPWVRVPAHEDSMIDSATFTERPRIPVKTIDDLQTVLASIGRNPVISLQPSDELLRDDAFLGEVARVASAAELPIEMSGSPLAHGYYQLRKHGLTVLCHDNPDEPLQVFRKLVRDQIVPTIQDHGERVVSYVATENERLLLTKRKLVEEAIEVLEADGPGGTLEELADVEEVLAALREILGIDLAAVQSIQDAKRERRGGFQEGSVLVETGGGPPPDEDALFAADGLPRQITSSQVEREGGRLRLSLIPPPPDQRAPFEFELGNVLIRCRYESHSMTIELETIETRERVEPDALFNQGPEHLEPQTDDEAAPS